MIRLISELGHLNIQEESSDSLDRFQTQQSLKSSANNALEAARQLGQTIAKPIVQDPEPNLSRR